jgi:UDP-D-galactose:(glucosyl)LPS alpha-1,3-D-galactosyltransferase
MTDCAQARTGELPRIVCTIDERYLPGVHVLMESLAAAHAGVTDSLRFVVVHEGLSDRAERRLHDHARALGLAFEARAVTDLDSPAPIFGRWTRAHCLLLELGDVLEDDVVLYLDADILVLGDLRPLLREDLLGAPLAAVRDPTQPTLALASSALPGWQRLGLSAQREYFNTGVLLLDLHECRRRGVFSEARRFLRDHPDHVAFPDQDALNWSVRDRWKRLERRWNTFALSPVLSVRPDYVHEAEPAMALDVLLRDESEAVLLHYFGSKKPWEAHYPPGPLTDLYRGHLATSREHWSSTR